jgi:hypothetical protein
MMGKGKLYDIKLTATIDKGNLKFSATSSGLGQSNSNGVDKFTFNKNKNNMLKSDCYLIQFTLDDQTDRNLHFPQSASDALWACLAADPNNPPGSCPNVAPPNPSTQMKGLAVLDDHCLLAMNKDGNSETLVFALNFDSDVGPAQWDPIGDNQDGGK